MKNLIVIIAAILITVGFGCKKVESTEAQKPDLNWMTDESVFTVVDTMLSENPEAPGTFIHTLDTFQITRSHHYSLTKDTSYVTFSESGKD